MRIGLASYVCKNRNVSFNMTQIEKAMRESQGKIDLLCFGEAYLQGFDSLCWDYALDNEMALELNSDTISQLCKWSKEYGIELLTGYIEKDEECLYSSCVVIENGKILHNYRRITKSMWRYVGLSGEVQNRTSVDLACICRLYCRRME